MRNALCAGKSIEIAGYDIAPALVSAIDALDARTLWTNVTPIHWFHIGRTTESAMPPATTELLDEWTRNGANLYRYVVPGLPFWATQELSQCSELLTLTTVLAEDASFFQYEL
jgi:hypothetical protein